MTLETIADSANILTGAFAVGASLIGLVWWWCSRRTRKKQLQQHIEFMQEVEKNQRKFRDEMLAIQPKRPNIFKQQVQMLTLMNDNLETLFRMLLIHSGYSMLGSYDEPELLGFLKGWKVQSPLTREN